MVTAMPEAKRIPLNLRSLREQAMRSRAELADELGLSLQLLAKLEHGQGNARLSTVFQICLVLAIHLKQPPQTVLERLMPAELFADFDEIREQAALRLRTLDTHRGSYKAKRRFLKERSEISSHEQPPENVSLQRFQELFAKSRFSQAELSRLTDLSERRLNNIFSISASKTGNMSLWVFLRLAAALAPVYKADTKETALYLIGGDLERLAELYKAAPQIRVQ